MRINHAAFGLLAIFTAFAAVVAYSEAVSYADRDRLLYGYLAVLLVLLGASVKDLISNARFGYSVLIFGSIFFFAWPGVRMLFTGMEFGEKFRKTLLPAEVAEGVFYTSTFLTAALAAYLILALCIRSRAFASLRDVSHGSVAGVIVGLFVLVALPYILLGGGIENTIGGILSSRSGAVAKGWKQAELMGDAMSPLWVFSRPALAVVTSFGFSWWLWSRKGTPQLVLLGISVLSGLVLFFDTGTRSWFLLAVSGPAFIYIRRSLSVFSPTKIVAAGALVMIVFALAQFQLQYRTTGTFDFSDESSVLSIDDNDFLTETSLAVISLDGLPHVRESTFLLFASNPVPRFLWANKPIPETLRHYTFFIRGFDFTERAGGNSLPSVVGQFYLKRGLPAVVLIGVIFGALYYFFDSLWMCSERNAVLMLFCGTGMMLLFLAHRGLYPGFHYAVMMYAGLYVVGKWNLERQARATQATRPHHHQQPSLV